MPRDTLVQLDADGRAITPPGRYPPGTRVTLHALGLSSLLRRDQNATVLSWNGPRLCYSLLLEGGG